MPDGAEAAIVDAAPPAFTARLESDGVIRIALGEPVSGTARAADWAVAQGASPVGGVMVRAADGGAPPAATVALDGATAFAITHDALGRTDADALRVTYTRPADASLPGNEPAVRDLFGNHIGGLAAGADLAADVSDGAPPTVSSARLTDTVDSAGMPVQDGRADTATIDFSEAVTAPADAATFGLYREQSGGTALTTGTATQGDANMLAGSRYTIALADQVPLGTYWMDVSVSDTADPANAYAAGRVRVAFDTGIPSFTARTHNATSVAVTFTENVGGHTSASEWTVNGMAIDRLDTLTGAARRTAVTLSAESGPLYLSLDASTPAGSRIAASDTATVAFAPDTPTLAEPAHSRKRQTLFSY